MAWTNTKKIIVCGTVSALVILSVAAILYFERRDIADWMTVSEAKHAVAKHIATPLDLTASYASPASAMEDSSSYWGEVPWEFQVFRHVPLQIDGVMYLWGAGNAKAGAVFPEEILGIPVKHSTFIIARSMYRRKAPPFTTWCSVTKTVIPRPTPSDMALTQWTLTRPVALK
jgi:hypothetical protein